MVTQRNRNGNINDLNTDDPTENDFVGKRRRRTSVTVALTGKRRNINSTCTSTSTSCTRRRLFLLSSATAVLFNNNTNVHALTVESLPSTSDLNSDSDLLPTLPKPTSARKKPFAPLQALLPASRVKLTIDNAIAVANEIIELDASYKYQNNVNTSTMSMPVSVSVSVSVSVNSEAYKSKKNELANALNGIIIEREQRGFMTPLFISNERNDGSTATTTATNASLNRKSNTKLYDETYKEKLNNLSSPTEIPLALLSQAGDKRQFQILQSRQRKLESKSPIRQALNYYTRQLVFNTETYVLNANAETKKQMIRNDALPDIQSVIVSDLDLRDLVRNQILDAYDDVRAELQYQLKNSNSNNGTADNIEEFDATELRELLLRAQKECNEWFGFIEERDVQEAMDVVTLEVK